MRGPHTGVPDFLSNVEEPYFGQGFVGGEN